MSAPVATTIAAAKLMPDKIAGITVEGKITRVFEPKQHENPDGKWETQSVLLQDDTTTCLVSISSPKFPLVEGQMIRCGWPVSGLGKGVQVNKYPGTDQNNQPEEKFALRAPGGGVEIIAHPGEITGGGPPGNATYDGSPRGAQQAAPVQQAAPPGTMTVSEHFDLQVEYVLKWASSKAEPVLSSVAVAALVDTMMIALNRGEIVRDIAHGTGPGHDTAPPPGYAPDPAQGQDERLSDEQLQAATGGGGANVQALRPGLKSTDVQPVGQAMDEDDIPF